MSGVCQTDHKGDVLTAYTSRLKKNIQLLNVRKKEVEIQLHAHDKSLSDAKVHFNRASRELTSLKAELIKLQRQKEGHTRYIMAASHMHTHTHAHTCAHTHIHTVHTYIHTYIHTCMHTYILVLTCIAFIALY